VVTLAVLTIVPALVILLLTRPLTSPASIIAAKRQIAAGLGFSAAC
jgi:hypothetical protein